MNKQIRKRVIMVLYWFSFLIKTILKLPFMMFGLSLSITIYMINIGFVYNVFEHRETYESWQECKELVVDEPGLCLVGSFLWLAIPLCIPAFVLRHLYFCSVKIDELYREIQEP